MNIDRIEVRYNLASDLIGELRWCEEYPVSLKRLSPLEFELTYRNGVVVKAVKRSHFRSWWTFEFEDEEVFHTDYNGQRELIFDKIVELVKSKAAVKLNPSSASESGLLQSRSLGFKMVVRCAWCNRVIGRTRCVEANKNEVSHGICKACIKYHLHRSEKCSAKSTKA